MQNGSKEEYAMEPLQNDQSTEVEVVDVNRKWRRGHWASQLDFLLSLIGYSVGLGNLWRFPYLCMKNGGGAFLVPYFTFLFILGLPLFFLELSIGQFSSLSPLTVFKLSPLFKGIGWSMMTVTAIITIYYNIIIAWTLYFLVMSFTSHLPWTDCDNSWNTLRCLRPVNGSFINSTAGDKTDVSVEANTTANTTQLAWRTPAEEFWQFNVLELSSGIDDLGGIRWQLMLCLLLAWTLSFLCLIRGIRSLGKVAYVTATAPYILLTILLIRGAMLPGAVDGIIFYIKPDFNRLLRFETWAEGCLQIFYSLGPGWGGLISMSSHNKFKNNCFRDSFIVCCACSGTSFFAGFVVFSIIGFMAQQAGQTVDQVVTSGPGLAFIVYPGAISKLPISPFWAVCFFLMLLSIGLDSQMCNLEAVVNCCVDLYPTVLLRHKTAFTGAVSFVMFCIGLLLVSRAGMYIFFILDWYAAAFSLMLIGLLESLVLSWIYGFDRLYYEMEMMLGYRPSVVWKAFWGVVTPLLLLAILIYNMAELSPPKYGDYEYPGWARGLGLVVSMLSVVPIPGYMIYALYREEGPLLQRVRRLLPPEADWGPAAEPYRSQYKYWKTGHSTKSCQKSLLSQ